MLCAEEEPLRLLDELLRLLDKPCIWRRPPHAGQIKETQQLIQKAQRLLLSAVHHIRESQRMIREEGDLL